MTPAPAIAHTPARTIDEIIARLTDIIDRSRREPSGLGRLGYFAALYRKVTISVKEGIQTGRFEDGARMERLDMNFANRYLKAYDLHRANQIPTASWRLSFEAAGHWRPIVLQHLLLGMNAHINLDLGFAAVETCPGDQLLPLKRDFDEINRVLAELVQPVQDEIGEVSPWIGFLEKIDSKANDAIINFSMDRARASAWNFAMKLNSLGEDERFAAVKTRDQGVVELGQRVYKPGRVILPLGLLAIRLRESSDVAHVIDVLS
ncbi:MAG: DUF5995 family protein [Blastocatellales bacterium]